jgi:hypothetical protein
MHCCTTSPLGGSSGEAQSDERVHSPVPVVRRVALHLLSGVSRAHPRARIAQALARAVRACVKPCGIGFGGGIHGLAVEARDRAAKAVHGRRGVHPPAGPTTDLPLRLARRLRAVGGLHGQPGGRAIICRNPHGIMRYVDPHATSIRIDMTAAAPSYVALVRALVRRRLRAEARTVLTPLPVTLRCRIAVVHQLTRRWRAWPKRLSGERGGHWDRDARGVQRGATRRHGRGAAWAADIAEDRLRRDALAAGGVDTRGSHTRTLPGPTAVQPARVSRTTLPLILPHVPPLCQPSLADGGLEPSRTTRGVGRGGTADGSRCVRGALVRVRRC